MKRLILPFLFLFLVSNAAQACDSCGCTLARVTRDGKLSGKSSPVFSDFTFEQQVWHQRDIALAHSLHHQGHDSHDKLREEFYHFALGANPWERVSLLAELPYVVRHFLEVDNHQILGQRQRSEGFGDLSLTGIYKLLKQEDNFIGPVAGLKFPTGSTAGRNEAGNKLEPELQPGSGSFDPILGSAFEYRAGRFGVHGNALYTLRTRGGQHFKFGNLFSTYLYVDYLLNSKSKYFQTRAGLDTTLQNEQRQRDRTGPVADSGGTTWLMGPEISVQGNRHVSIFGNFLLPVYQNLGGVHQTLRFVWNAGVKIAF